MSASVPSDLPSAASNTSSSSSSTSATSSLAGTPGCENDWVRLNVGGRVFTTTRRTLSKEPGSFLHRLVTDAATSGLGSVKDDSGAFLIDRDPDYFGPVLNYLRHGRLVVDKNIAEEGVLEEAEFYNLKTLIALVKERIHNRDHNGSGDGRRLVYRVLQCHEDELANLASTLSDGWKFEQVIKVRQDRVFNADSLGSSGGSQVELLCIVSKEYPSAQTNGETTEKAKVRRTICKEGEFNVF